MMKVGTWTYFQPSITSQPKKKPQSVGLILNASLKLARTNKQQQQHLKLTKKQLPWLPSCDYPCWVRYMHRIEEEEEQEKDGDDPPILPSERIISNPQGNYLEWLKACASQKDLESGSRLHVEIIRKGLLERDSCVGNALVTMYAKCGALAKAQEVFDVLPARDVVSWNALISGYAQHGHGKEALNCFWHMKHKGITPNAVTYACSLRASGITGAIDVGEEICAEIASKGLLVNDLILGTALVDMYGKCGLLEKAQNVFDKLPVRNEVSWGALIAGYAQHGFGDEALICFGQMQLEGIPANAIIFVCILKACGSIGAINRGLEIHAEIARNGLLKKNSFVGNALVDMYGKCGLLTKAQDVFDKLPVRDVVSWSALIAGYAQYGHGGEALNYFEQMQLGGIPPTAITFMSVLKACGNIRDLVKGKEIHLEIMKKGLLKRDPIVGSALVAMYAKCGLVDKAHEVLDMLPLRNVLSWSALIAGYARLGYSKGALLCFERMKSENVTPNAITFVAVLKACGSLKAADKGQALHAEISETGLLEKDIVLATALVDMYAKCGLLTKSQEVFDKLPVQSKVLWSVLIGGYTQHGLGEEALECFVRMQVTGVIPSAVTFMFLLKCCGSLGTIDKGQKIQEEITKIGLLETNTCIGNALVDMYAKFGLLVKSQEVFDKLPVQDIVSWNALISGYAQLGKTENVFSVFDKMVGDAMRPDSITFIGVLNACSHAGLVDEGQLYFKSMSNEYCLTPTFEHYGCMVDLLSRAGQLDKALAIIKQMPFHANLVMWLTVLGACRKWGNVSLGRLSFEHAVQLDERESAAYLCMSSIYIDAGMQREAEKVQDLMVKKQAWNPQVHCQWTDTSEIVQISPDRVSIL